MTRFDDLKLKPLTNTMVGPKIPVNSIVGKEITLHHYDVQPSKFQGKGNGKRLCLQITFNGEKRIVFTSSVVLQRTLEQIPNDSYPLLTTIVYQDQSLKFT